MAVARKKTAAKKTARPAGKAHTKPRPAARAARAKGAAASARHGAKPARPAAKPARRAAHAAPTPPSRPAKAARAGKTPAPAPAAKARPTHLSPRDLETYRKLLLNLRDQIVDEISFLAGENLNNSQREASGDLSNYGMHMADQGTDNFDREFALSLVSNEQEVLYEIDEALHRIEAKTYGICEMTGQAIEPERLKVLPYARYSREAQEEMERNRKRFRPFTASVIPPSEG